MMSDKGATPRNCAICGSILSSVGRIEGYVEGQYFDLDDCKRCDTTSASPREVDNELYDTIYRNADALPGYWRYLGYAKRVLEETSPLAYLAAHEDMYWAVQRFLPANPTGEPKKPRVLEIGSGLGYLTYSIAKAGFDILGLELSPVAVARARNRYGDLFACGQLEKYALERTQEFDYIVITEVLEHVTAPVSLLQAAMRLLSPEGKLLVTTPNRSYFRGARSWGSDLPPVHLWWFSENSMRALAIRLGADVKFPGFRQFNNAHPQNPLDRWFKESFQAEPVLDSAMHPRSCRGRSQGIVAKPWFVGRIPWRLQRACMIGLNAVLNPLGKRETLAAVFSKQKPEQ